MRRMLAACILGISAVACGAHAVPAAVYYVSPTGSDSGPGSATQPWLTLQNAANHVQAGDAVNVAAGNYAGFVMGWDTSISGTASAPITFSAAAGAVINARNSHTGDGIDLEPGCNYITIQGFTIQNPTGGGITRAGIRVTGSDGVIVRNNTADNCGTWGIFTSHANNVLVEHNTASHAQTQHGIYISNASVGPVVRGNTVFGNAGCGIHFNGDLSQGGTGVITNGIVEQNVVHDNGISGGSAINCDGLQDSVIRNNLLYANHAGGIALFDIDAAAGATNNQVVNNTIINAADSRNAININSGSTGNTLFNNIIFDLNSSSLRGAIAITSDSQSGFLSDYNFLDPRFLVNDSAQTLSQWRATGNDTHSTPLTLSQMQSLFGNYGGNDYTLATHSAAIDAGVSGLLNGSVLMPAPGNDLAGVSRPQGPAYDVGSYEATPLYGDANGDGTVNGADLNVVLSNYSQTGMDWTHGDFNGDGTVNHFAIMFEGRLPELTSK
jgi:parallel beta-helix repeat protein